MVICRYFDATNLKRTFYLHKTWKIVIRRSWRSGAAEGSVDVRVAGTVSVPKERFRRHGKVSLGITPSRIASSRTQRHIDMLCERKGFIFGIWWRNLQIFGTLALQNYGNDPIWLFRVFAFYQSIPHLNSRMGAEIWRHFMIFIQVWVKPSGSARR